jgi:Putative binding domain, N-terminal
VSPASGILSAGHSQTITVTLTPNPGSRTPYTSTVTVDPGGMTVTVLYVPSA